MRPSSKYKKWHDAIIYRARSRTLDRYSERHHIKPRSFGGSDEPDNLVDLTYREHFLVHWLLTKICEGVERRKMVMALRSMTFPLGARIVAGWRIEVSKRALRDEWARRLTERHAREIERQHLALEAHFAQLARDEANTAAIAVWRSQRKPQRRNGSGQFEKVQRKRARPRAGKKWRAYQAQIKSQSQGAGPQTS